MRYQRSSSLVPLFIFGSYLISWSIWICRGYFHAAFHIEIANWTIDIPQQSFFTALGNVGPAISATVAVGLADGRAGVRRLWSGLTIWRFHPAWILFVCLLIPILQSISLLCYALLGGKIGDTGGLIRLVFLIALNLPLGPVWEEIGWRGFLLPRLQGKHNALVASVIVACIWGPWHLPLYWRDSFEWWLWYLAIVFGLSILLTWIYNRSHGSLVPGALLHVSADTTTLYFLGPTMRMGGMMAFRLVAGSICCAALVVLISTGTNLCKDLRGTALPESQFLPDRS